MAYWGCIGAGKSDRSKTQQDTDESVRHTDRSHNPFGEVCWVSCLRGNLTSSSYGEGLETGLTTPRQSFTRQVFFRWIKQHLNVPALFGTTPNAVYSQLYIALLVYVLLKSVYDEIHPRVPIFSDLSFVNFTRRLSLQLLPAD
ncbi:hypothetical protein ACTHRH_20375 [Paenibacillus sp. SAFN-117]